MSAQSLVMWLSMSAALPLVAVGCGEEVVPEDTSCSGGQPLRVIGEAGEIDGTFIRNNTLGTLAVDVPVGEVTDRRITVDMGTVEFLVAGSDEAEERPRLLVLQTNVADPEGSNLLENLNRRLNSGVEGADTLQVVNRDEGEYCDVEQGEICARFGLDNTANRELEKDSDGVVHLGVGGQVRVKTLTSTLIALEWDVEFGPNISKFGDASSGQLEGCLSTQRGNAAAGIEPLEVPGS